AGAARLSQELLSGPGLGQAVGVHEYEVAGGELDLPADVVGAGVEGQQGPGGAQGPYFAVVPQPGRRVTGRCVAQAVGQAVEDHDAHGDELLGPALGGQRGVELLESLRRVAELTQEHAQQVLDLEGGDGRFDAVSRYV